MEYKLTIICTSEAELADVTSRLTAVAFAPEASAETAPDAPAGAPQTAPAAEADKHPAPAKMTASAAQPAGQDVTLAMIQAVGRKLVAAQRSAEVQKVLQAHGVRLMSKLPADSYPAVYAELNALLEGRDHAPA